MRESREIKKDNAEAVKNSGRGLRKGDAVIGGKYLVDYKDYTKGYRITYDNWVKHALDAIESGYKTPCFAVTLNDGDDSRKVAIIPWDHFMRLQEAYDE